MNYTSKKLNTAERFILTVLDQIPQTRDDDRLLMLEVWERQGLHFSEEQKRMFMKVMLPETIRRNRQDLQAHGYCRASEKVQQDRMFESKRYTEHFRVRHEGDSAEEFEEWLNK